MSTYEDNLLISEFLKGKITAFNKIVNKHKDMVYTVTMRVTGNNEDALEAAQDTFLKIHKSLVNFKGDSNFTTWLYRIAYNTAVSKTRTNKKHIQNNATHEFNINEISENSVENYDRQDRNKYIRLAVNKLKPDEKLILELFYFSEKKVEEIAKITGNTASNIKIKLFRGRKNVYKELKLILKSDFADIFYTEAV